MTARESAAASRTAYVPLSHVQRRLWLLDQMEGSRRYHLIAAWRLRGPLRYPALARALTIIATRHESLRTRIVPDAGDARQVIDAPAPVHLPIADLSALDAETQDARIQAMLRHELDRPFDLARGPVWRMRLLRLGAEDHVLTRTIHHIVFDWWSHDQFNRELEAWYASGEDQSPPLPPLEVQYQDFARWQRTALDGQGRTDATTYWTTKLAGLPERLALPADRPLPPSPTFASRRYAVTLDPALTSRLEALGRSRRATVYMTLLSAFAALLTRYTGERDIAIGSPIANRLQAELEPLIGCFLNTLVIRVDVADGISFAALLDQVRRTTLEAYRYREEPFERLVELLAPGRTRHATPLFHVAFQVQHGPWSSPALAGLDVQPIETDCELTRSDLAVHARVCNQQIRIEWQYSTERFDAWRIAQMASHYVRVLEAAADRPEVCVDAIALMTGTERRQVVSAWDEARRQYATHGETWQRIPDGLLQRGWEQWARDRPDAVALSAGDRQITYRELADRTSRLARRIRAAAPDGTELVGVLTVDPLTTIAGIIGVLRAGFGFVPLDPDLPAARLRAMVEECALALTLVDEVSTGLAREWPGVTCVAIDEAMHATQASEPLSSAWPWPADRPCYVYFTSGSTGQPRAIAGRLRGLEQFIAWELNALGVDGPVRVSQLTRLGFDASLRDIFLALCAGGTVCIPPLADIRADGPSLIEWLTMARVEVMHCVPTVLRLLLHALQPGVALPALRHVLVAGEPLLPADVHLWFATLGGQASLRNLYGATETTMVKFVHLVEAGDAALNSVPIGRPMPGAAALVLDGHGEPAPHGVSGEIQVWTPFRTLGYYRRPDLTAQCFVPLAPAEGLSDGAGDVHYRTGDIGRTRPDGTFEFGGRRDALIKLRGVRVELGDIETALLDHPDVRLAAVVPRGEPPADVRLVAYVVRTHDRDASIDARGAADRVAHRAQTAQLREHLRARLPVSMVPEAFVFLDRLPLTSNGKVDRRALPDAVVSDDEEADADAHADVRTPIEQLLSKIYADVLRLERIGIDDDFFDRGGHSLVAMQAVARIRQATGVEMTLRQMLAAPTVRALAREVDRLLLGGAAPTRQAIARIPRSGVLPVSVDQEGRLALDAVKRRHGSAGPFHMAHGLRLTGAFDVKAMARAMQAVIARHEALRTGFTSVPSVGAFIVDDPRIVFGVVSLDHLDPSARDRVVARISHDVANRPFDLAAPPLVRGVVLRLAADEHVMLIVVHHLVCDGWSFRLLFEDLDAAYRACVAGEEPGSDRHAIDFVDFAHWERQSLQRPAARAAIDYWTRQLDAFAPAMLWCKDLPFAIAGARDPNPVREDEAVTIDGAFASALRQVSRRRDLTLHMLFMAAFHIVLQACTGQTCSVVRALFAGRSWLEVERVIGWFARSHIVGVEAGPDVTLGAVLERTREAILGAHGHQDVPEMWVLMNALMRGRPSLLPSTDVFVSLELGVSDDVPDAVAGGQTFPLRRETSQSLLRISIIDRPREIVVGCRYSGGSFHRSGVATMLDDLTRVLKHMVESPHSLTREVQPWKDEVRRRETPTALWHASSSTPV